MRKRRKANSITLINKSIANSKIDKRTRKQQIINILRNKRRDMTAREIAYKLFEDGLVPFFERNTVAPRITELCQEGILEPKYTDTDIWTGHLVTAYYFTAKVIKNNYKTNYDEINNMVVNR